MMPSNDQRESMQLADLNLAAMIRHRMKTATNALLQEQDGVLLFTISYSRAIVGIVRRRNEVYFDRSELLAVIARQHVA